MGISGAISIPFIVIAFNQDRIAEFLKEHKKSTIAWGCSLLSVAVLLSVMWTRDLNSGLKAGVTVTFAFITMIGLIGQCIYWIVSAARMAVSSSGSSRSLIDD